MPVRNFRTEGIIIKRRNIGEADRILTLLTPFNGKIYVKAPGVRKITSRRSSHIEPFTHSLFTLYRGRATPIVTEVQCIEYFILLRENLTKIGSAYYFCELIDGLCAQDQEQLSVFNLLKKSLSHLNMDGDIESIVHNFEIELLIRLGFYKQSSETKNFNASEFIEQLLERRLKTRRMYQFF
ncbi:MAG: DNA repair protein RecO [Candidatus Levybacteria bacterium]|nr:DNA repair protein RecO [Candidatus Levybacteria bacterium]